MLADSGKCQSFSFRLHYISIFHRQKWRMNYHEKIHSCAIAILGRVSGNMKLPIIFFSLVAAGLVLLVSCDQKSQAPQSPSSPDGSAAVTISPSAAAGPFITASPNPVPGGPGVGTTTITWKTGDDSVGEVYVWDGVKEHLFARAAKGASSDAPWIGAGSTEFRLYGTDHAKVLATVIVTRSKTAEGDNSLVTPPPPASTNDSNAAISGTPSVTPLSSPGP